MSNRVNRYACTFQISSKWYCSSLRVGVSFDTSPLLTITIMGVEVLKRSDW